MVLPERRFPNHLGSACSRGRSTSLGLRLVQWGAFTGASVVVQTLLAVRKGGALSPAPARSSRPVEAAVPKEILRGGLWRSQ